MTLRLELSMMLKDLDAADAAANDLWSWLPSYTVAKRHHGDYVLEVCPSPTDVMNEAATVLALQRSGREPNEEEKALLESCPCGEGHANDETVEDQRARRKAREAEVAAIPFDERCWHARGGQHNAGPICVLRHDHEELHQSIDGDVWGHSDDSRPPEVDRTKR